MGNEGSKLRGLIIEKNAVEANDFWTLYNAESSASSNEEGSSSGLLLSVFQGEHLVKGQLWAEGAGPMERCIKNLMVYRHPYILKYIATWEKSGQKHLATERVRPLNEVLAEQSGMQICLGLRTILCSLIFLIEKALARHLNISIHSIYVTDSGNWRLAGFEYVWKANEVNGQLIDLARHFMDPSNRGEDFEQFAFATLCEQVLDKRSSTKDVTPHYHEFREYCNSHMKHQISELRPKLSAVLLHPYFNHEFVFIHSFLFELPLKSVQERQNFFATLIERLRCFDEQVVASELASSLLSRMVLLDPTAHQFVTPNVLRTKATTAKATVPLFSPQIYVKYLLPHILKMFRLRDAQIRLILLDYFMDYVRLLSDEQLLSEILPNLQLGMNDTNDVLVAKTLRCMADLVPILGAHKVLGGENRKRCFSDGRPHAAVSTDIQNPVQEPRSITPLMNGCSVDVEEDGFMMSGSPLPTETVSSADHFELRLSPDGGEDDKNANLSEESSLDIGNRNISSVGEAHEKNAPNGNEDDMWSDWDVTDELQRLHYKQPKVEEAGIQNNLSSKNVDTKNSAPISETYQAASNPTASSNISIGAVKTSTHLIDDLSALDIQVQLMTSAVDGSELTEFDFFKDMEPVIGAKASGSRATEAISSRFAAADSLQFNDDSLNAKVDQGWGHDEEEDDDVVWGVTNAVTT
ncbi:protein-associating with the carboxyl-terminal domain of ezrin [Drosophila kikkawai]|uniref:Protein-associating with the carboxyl-terminal domain of ezrin n=1 Tax=Drosophila kikkawai TaxID=30033 RepID=A0A6P4I989_DROKI|nr:protein-associating with the carboxyl-terminal domain of ezrin [Drosophila kikkawai]KAH8354601.1 hypothetical protein KR059_012181 [Drosophila kikkawai]